jgi:hypothetical protein
MPVLWIIFLPGLVSAQPGALQGTVKDVSGSAVTGAIVTLEAAASPARTATADPTGSFRFSGVAPGDYKITIGAAGFAVWTAANVAVDASDNPTSLSAVLQVAAASSSVDVTLSQREVAAEQLKAEEKQRLLGVFPQFFVSYDPNAAPLTATQKFHLGWRSITDPVVFLSTGIVAGMQQERNNYPEFGQGVEGYGKRYGAVYADRVSETMIGHVVMQSIFHQDPRYFYKGTGSVRSRALYAIGAAFVRKGDNGHWQPDYSDVLGDLAAHEISTLYYPASSRPGRRLADSVLLGFGGRAANNLLHEFVLRKLTTHVSKWAAGHTQLILREGTPVSLVSVEAWDAKTAENGGSVAFTLANDIQVDGVIAAKIGSRAWGRVSSAGAAGQVGFSEMRLKVGDTDVPLRGTPLPGGDGALESHRVENSARIAIRLYAARNITLRPAQ